MRAFADLNPITILIYFICVSLFPMFCMDLFVLGISLFGAVLLFVVRNEKNKLNVHLFSVFLFFIMSIINPIISHNGETVLLVINNKPITFEALVYGMCSSAMIVSILYWFRTFSLIMTADKIIYILGRFSHKIALVTSMALRYIPLFKLQIKKVNQTQKTLGIYNEDNILDDIKGKIRVFSVMVTWTLENGIITAESMEARGYGVGKRSRYTVYKFNYSDIVFLLLSVFFATMTFIFVWNSSFKFYPKIDYFASKTTYIGYASYFVLTILPVIIEVKEKIKWKYLELRI